MIDDWREVSRRLVFTRYGRSVQRVDFALPTGAVHDFYIKVEAPAVCVVALTGDDEVLVTRQFRPGPMKILYELPGGAVEPGEDPRAAMERELLEETGYAGDLELVTSCLDDAYSTVVRHCFVATGCTSVCEASPDTTEFIQPQRLRISEFRKLLRSGQMTDVEAGYLGLDHLGLL
ncbi:NUDIX hydrolase [Catellatospora sp. NPDC049111]|uniref:NUDIX hydrolase n=1 Tax=Catellatospora sp. NPDC049111 TaxID=3155271 RepID=UPI0033F60165